MPSETSNKRPSTQFRLSQETIAIVTVGIALAGLNLATVGDLRDEARADRAAWQAESRQLRDEARADRAAWQAENQRRRDEARADRAAWQAENQRRRDEFQREILRLTAEHAKLATVVDPD